MKTRLKGYPVHTAAGAVIGLSILIGVMSLVAAGIGLVTGIGSDPVTVTSIRGETVELYGRGLYQYDSLFAGAANLGTDAVTLFLGIPLLAVTTLFFRRGSLRGGLLMMGALAWFLYAYASYAMGAVAYNELFLVYVALFSASLFALVFAFRAIDRRPLSADVSPNLPRRGLTIFMIASGAVTMIIWLIAPVAALFEGGPPMGLDTYSTLFTTALDVAVIVPVVLLTGWLVLRRDPLGYLLAAPMLVLEAMLAPMIAAQTVSQVSAGVSFTTGEIVGPIIGFVTLALLAIWFLIDLLRHIPDRSQTVPAVARESIHVEVRDARATMENRS